MEHVHEPGRHGLSHLSTLVWPSGLVEVFALGSGGDAWHDYFDTGTGNWVGWASLGSGAGGTAFSEGPRPLVWADGHGELYEVDSSGNVWRSTSASGSGTDWTTFAQVGSNSGIASRLSPVRWPDGTVELFGRGTDGNLWRDATSAGAFGSFTMLATQATTGEPSAFMNPGSGAEVVTRDATGNVIDIVYSVASGSWPASFTSLGEVAASDPFAWIRGDGNAEVFAVDGTGNLVHSLRSSGSWSSWGNIGAGLDACAPAIAYVDGGMSSSGGSSSTAASSSASSSGSSSRTGSSSGSTPAPAPTRAPKSASSGGSSSETGFELQLQRLEPRRRRWPPAHAGGQRRLQLRLGQRRRLAVGAVRRAGAVPAAQATRVAGALAPRAAGVRPRGGLR